MITKTPKKASQKDWHPERIKAALRIEAGLTLKRLALLHGLKDSSSLSAALVRSHPLNEMRIAEALKRPPQEIFPSRYFEDGTRKPQGFHALQCTNDRAAPGELPERAELAA